MTSISSIRKSSIGGYYSRGPSKETSGSIGPEHWGSILNNPNFSSARTRRRIHTGNVRMAADDPRNYHALDSHAQENGSLTERVGVLFNNFNMSDIVFLVGDKQIPAHRFILACSSPTLYQRLVDPHLVDDRGRHGLNRMEDSRPGSQLLSHEFATLKIQVDFPYEAFYEFIKFLYTDELSLTLGTVPTLIAMADHFKLRSIASRCFQFLRKHLWPETTLTILDIARGFMCRAVICLWRDVIERRKLMEDFTNLCLRERQQRMEAIKQRSRSPSFSAAMPSVRSNTSRPSSATSQFNIYFPASGRSRTHSRSSYGDESSETWHNESLAGHPYYGEVANDIYRMSQGKLGSNREADKKMYSALFSEARYLQMKCWKIIRENTETVIFGPDWLHQTINMVRAVLRLNVLAISEVQLFRAVNRWCEHRCEAAGLPLLPDSRRKVLGKETIELIRFPLMTLEELQWDVVPTGLLDYEAVHGLHGGTSWISNFCSEPRILPLGEQHAPAPSPPTNRRDDRRQLVMSLDHEGVRQDTGNDGARLMPSPRYHPAKGDVLDNLIGAKLWRHHVDEVLSEQAQQGIAHEAGVEIGHDSWPILCGSGRAMEGQRQDHRRPHWQWKKFQHSVMTASPMAVPCVALRAETRVHTPRAPTAGSEPPTPPRLHSSGSNPNEYKRLAPGLYRFRGHRAIELRFEGGDTVVYEHSQCRLPPLDRDTELADLEVGDVRKSLGIPQLPPGRGMNLEGFIHRPPSTHLGFHDVLPDMPDRCDKAFAH